VDLTAGGPLRVRIPLGIAYKEQTGAARAVLMPLLRNHPKVMAQPEPRVRMIELGDSSLNLEMVYWLAPGDVDVAPSISFELLEAAKGALDTAGIEIPFPHLQLFVDSVRGVEPLAERIMESYQGRAGS
jgi:small-conductance mechanosensitive channel